MTIKIILFNSMIFFKYSKFFVSLLKGPALLVKTVNEIKGFGNEKFWSQLEAPLFTILNIEWKVSNAYQLTSLDLDHFTLKIALLRQFTLKGGCLKSSRRNQYIIIIAKALRDQ